MNDVEVLEIGKQAIWVLLKISVPIMLVALIVGLVISLFQALTQIQEMTLSFVPKIIAMGLAMILLLPLMGSSLMDFSRELYGKITEVGKSTE